MQGYYFKSQTVKVDLGPTWISPPLSEVVDAILDVRLFLGEPLAKVEADFTSESCCKPMHFHLAPSPHFSHCLEGLDEWWAKVTLLAYFPPLSSSFPNSPSTLV